MVHALIRIPVSGNFKVLSVKLVIKKLFILCSLGIGKFDMKICFKFSNSDFVGT